MRRARSRSVVDLAGRASSRPCRGSASAGRARTRVERVLLAVEPGGQQPAAALAQLARPGASSSATSGTTSLAASVGRRGADVGDQVEQRAVGLVADRGHDRGAGREHRPEQALVGERQQVLDRAAAAGDHDDVDVGVAVEPARAPSITSAAGARALHGGVRRPRTRPPGQRRRAFSSDVALGGASSGR